MSYRFTKRVMICCWRYFSSQKIYGATYGKLYNWYAVNTGSLCPAGWHIPTDAEWQTLVVELGGDTEAGGAMKATTLWNSPNTGATNSSGFSGLPGGNRSYDGFFYNVGYSGYWWSSTENGASAAWSRYLGYDYGNAYRDYNSKADGFSCRCLRD